MLSCKDDVRECSHQPCRLASSPVCDVVAGVMAQGVWRCLCGVDGRPDASVIAFMMIVRGVGNCQADTNPQILSRASSALASKQGRSFQLAIFCEENL